MIKRVGSASAEATTGRRFPYIEHLRGFAASAVVIEHAWVLSGQNDTGIGAIISGLGDWGVSLFFLLSAFLLSGETFVLRNSRDLAAFYTRRFFRIAPAYYFMLLLVYPLMAPHQLLFSSSGAKQVLANIGFVQYAFPGTASNLNVNGSLWTLTIEAVLYLVLPGLGFLVARKPVGVFLAMVAVGVGFTYLIATHGSAVTHFYFGRAAVPVGMERLYVTRQFIGILPLFAIGIGVRWYFENAISYAKLRTSLRSIIAHFGLGTSLVLLAPSVLVCYYIGQANNYENPVLFSVFHVGLVLLMVPSLLVASYGLSTVVLLRGVRRLLRWLGEISYGVYLWHFPLLLAAFGGYRALSVDSMIAYTLVAYVLTVVIATASYYGVETPLRRYGQRLARDISGSRYLLEPPRKTEVSPS